MAGDLPRPSVVKMDMEGPELLALQGVEGLLSAEDRPRLLFVEINAEFLPAGRYRDFVRSGPETTPICTRIRQ